jgi:hypothetical protein
MGEFESLSHTRHSQSARCKIEMRGIKASYHRRRMSAQKLPFAAIRFGGLFREHVHALWLPAHFDATPVECRRGMEPGPIEWKCAV